jgi:hypothetical protein
LLGVLQRDGQLVDFLMEDIGAYSDDQIGAAVRKIHDDCGASLRKYVSLEPVVAGEDGGRYEVGLSFDPASIRLLGNVGGKPPFSGTIRHRGWRATSARLPALPAVKDATAVVIAPAEIEVV